MAQHGAIVARGGLTEARRQNQAYLKLVWDDHPTLHIWAAVAGLSIGLVLIPVLALVRRLRGRPAHSGGATAATLLAWVRC